MNLKQNPELLPLIEWWEKDGKQTVIYLVIAALVVGGVYAWKGHRAAVRTAAAEAVVNAYTTEELEESVAKFDKSPSAGVLKLRLAKSYFDNSRYEEALAQYEALVGNAPDGFAEVPVVGKAQCLEALGRYAEAAKAFGDFVEENPKSCLKLTAQLGAARCVAAGGDKAKALADLEKLGEEVKDDMLAKARVESVTDAVKRFGMAVSPAAVPEVKAEPAAKAAPVAAPAVPAAPAK